MIAPDTRPLRAAIVTNIPAPYRVPVFERLAATRGIAARVLFCNGREPDRDWDLPALAFDHEFLRPRVFAWRGRYIHANPDVAARLAAFAPDVVVSCGFNPSHLAAWFYARRRGLAHVAMTDGTLASEATHSPLHRAVRRAVYRRTRAFVGASDGSAALYRHYGVNPRVIYTSHLCCDNGAFADDRGNAPEPRFDFIFCGRFAPGKLPLFAIDVAARCAPRLGRRARLLMVGAGPLDASARRAAAAESARLETTFAGFARQRELPRHYADARLMLFPTLGDTWGVVANEACASGLPVLVSPHAGVAGELVRDGDNGRVLPLDAESWAEAAAAILSDRSTWKWMSSRSRELVAPYTHERAAAGLAAAIISAADTSATLPERPSRSPRWQSV